MLLFFWHDTAHPVGAISPVAAARSSLPLSGKAPGLRVADRSRARARTDWGTGASSSSRWRHGTPFRLFTTFVKTPRQAA
jgi:hypothetical protein